MKAVRLYEYGGPEKLIYEDNVPDPVLSDSTVLVEAVSASVNPIDWKVRSGARQKDFPLKLPAILGKDVSGIVRAVGTSVRTFQVGDRVMAFTDATYAELVLVEGSVLTHVPEGLNLIDAAAIPLVVLTGDQLVKTAARVQPGQTVLVTGALGSVGRAAVHSAKKLGAKVIAGVRSRQLAQARALGVVECLALDDDTAVAALPLVDAVADTVGGVTAAQLLAKVKQGGSFGFASVLPEGAAASHPAVTVTRVFARPDASKVREFADDIRDHQFVLPISHRLPLREAGQAQILMERGGSAGKILLLTPRSE